ncbi:VOC family protein [Massilia forsythiae]|uniref:Bleomycin resistance protein n=1 Tax=Massilia forsythiae TaxID=2728020 RepID=A0A7Z2VWZ1_9BURK|nr:VOC family protein [Massilia forsythiae]QJE00470.1 VOC family protein [Massilia forsythiae]
MQDAVSHDSAGGGADAGAMAGSTRFLGVSPSIPARDVEEAIAFYRDALGFGLRYRDAEPAGFAIVGCEGAELHLFASQDRHLAEWTSLRIGVAGIDALHARCVAAGCVHPNGQLGERPWGTREFSIVDPSGVCIALVQR